MLKIKNIRDYRSYYKNEVRDQPTRDENFIGNYYTDKDGAVAKKKFGWFEIYHGDKEGYGKAEAGIENFLQSFLDMARDGQAVYEFLQNAVDAKSTHFTMVWGEEESDGNQYLLVANNGEMFSFNSVRSILNVGSSTKSADSQTIGKFGIGFKLAHRLVGKDNGLQELLHENSGPVLFSWKNHELKELADGTAIEPQEIFFQSVDGQEYSILDENPWLFKILITCFPCLPENEFVDDLPRLVNGIKSEENPFSKQELAVLGSWVKKLLPSLNETTYKEGSLFFIRLGKGKEADLADKNLREGVRFSLAILNKTADKKPEETKVLDTVQLNNGDPITIPELNYLTFGIDKTEDQEDYIFIRFGVKSVDLLQRDQIDKLEREANIEVLIGFQDYENINNSFEGAPNFYLYFPLSEEVHNFNYILHCNAFYKGSSRTFLHRGSKGEEGINERLLSIIVERLFAQLQIHANSADAGDNKQFLNLYAALLTSGESQNKEREWIKEPYIEPITRELGKIIPVADDTQVKGFTIAAETDKVYVKSTDIEISSDWLNEPVKWFYWGTEYLEFRVKASEKLQLASYDVFSLLQNPGIYEKVNAWLDNDHQKIEMLLKELSAPAEHDIKTEAFIQNLIRLEMLSFSDGSTISLLKLDDLEDEGYLILHNTLSDIRDLLIKCQFKVSELDFNGFNFIDQYQNWLNAKSQLRGHTAVTKLFSQFLRDEDARLLTPEEKFQIFSAIRDLNSSNRVERVKELKLYCNKGGQVVYFKNLLLETGLPWLDPYVIDPKEYQTDLRIYVLSKDQDIYEGIIYPFWPKLSAELLHADKTEILTKIDELFSLYKPAEGEKELLKDYELLFFIGKSTACTNLYFTAALVDIPEEEYADAQNALFDFFKIQIPDRFFLQFADLEVFKLTQATPELSIEAIEIPKQKLAHVLDFCLHTKYDFFDQLLIEAANGNYVTKGKEEAEQYYSLNKLLISYTEKYHEGEYILLPAAFAPYSSLLELQNDMFTSKLVEEYEEGEIEQELDFIEAILTESTPQKKSVFNLIQNMPLDTLWENERQNRIYLNLIAGVLQADSESLSAVYEKVSLIKDETDLPLADIDQANDIIKLKRGEKEITLSQAEILNLPDKQSIKLVKKFAGECVDRNLLLESQATAIFKLSGRGITDELVKKFNSALKDKVISNAHQLAFLLLSDKFATGTIKEYRIVDASETQQVLEGPYVLTGADQEIYNSSYILGTAYLEFKELIFLGATESFHYGEDDNDIILPKYFFINGCECSVLNKETDDVILLDELLSCLKGTPNESIDKEHDQQDWNTIFEFDPALVVLHDLSVLEEQAPETVNDWLKKGDRSGKVRLMMALGASGPRSRIARLRQWLLSPSSVEFLPHEIHPIPHGLLYNSLSVLCGATVVEQLDTPLKLGIVDERLALIQLIWGILLKNEYEAFPLLSYLSPGELVITDPDETDIYYLADEYFTALKGQNELSDLYKIIPIAWLAHLHAADMVPILTELDLSEELFAEGSEEEHIESFYKKWKQTEQIILKKVPVILAKILVTVEEEQHFIGTMKPETQYILTEDEEVATIIYNQHLTLEQLEEQLDGEDEDIIAAIADLIKARDAALAGFYHMMSMAETPEGEQSMYKALQKAMQEESSRSERREYLDQMESSEPYSYNWFIAFLEYMQTYEQLASTTAQKSLNFQSITRYMIEDVLSEKYFMLYGAANLIPVNVDTFKNFNISLVFRNGRKENIKVEGVSARGQDLLIFCPSGLQTNILDNLEQVVNVSISFNPVLDLMYQLYKAFSDLEIITPWEDIREALPAIEFIYGPPGTGKTTNICNMLEKDYETNRNVRCLVLTPTNKASDVIVKRILASGNELRTVRLGIATDPELEELDEDVYQKSLSTPDMAYYNVVASTIHRFPYFQVLGKEGPDLKLFQLNNHWHYVVIDEASMVSLPYLVFILMSFSRQENLPKFIIAGDPMQIPPVLDLSDMDMEDTEIADMNVYTMLGIRSFKPTEQVLRPVDTIRNLDVQYRSVEAIGRIFSKISYEDQLTHGRDFTKEPVKVLPKEFAKMLPEPVSFINFPLNNNHAIYECRKLLYSSYHLYAGLLVAEIISHFDKCNTEQHWTIGVITPYKAQALITNKLIRSKPISNRLNIICNTVHSFQGDQCDLVIFLVNPNNNWYTGHLKSLLSKDYIYNVAISRARDYLWILNPFRDLSNPHIGKMVTVNKQAGGKSDIHSSEEIENEQFGKKKYIEEYSFVTGHDNINIYGQSEMKYFVRLNDFAIDVQVPQDQVTKSTS